MDNKKQTPVTTTGAIIIAGALIALAIMWTHKPVSSPTVTNPNPLLPKVAMVPVTASDHILGNPDAPIKFVEYSDLHAHFARCSIRS